VGAAIRQQASTESTAPETAPMSCGEATWCRVGQCSSRSRLRLVPHIVRQWAGGSAGQVNACVIGMGVDECSELAENSAVS
jgi:hypothetical protein